MVGSSTVTITNDSLTLEEVQVQLSYLEICNVGVADVGRYACEANNDTDSVRAYTELNIASKQSWTLKKNYLMMNILYCFYRCYFFLFVFFL